MKIPPRPGPLAQAFGRLQAWLQEHGARTARLCIGSVYFWFGALRFDPATPVAEAYLPGRVVAALTFGWLDGAQGATLLGFWECFIGFCLVAGIALRAALPLMLAHLLVMFLPMAVWPRQVWYAFPLGLTVRGQIILDNLVMIACAVVLTASAPLPAGPPRGGRLGRAWRAAFDAVARWAGRHGVFALRIAMGVLYVWFGALKYFPEQGDFGAFAGRLVGNLTGGLVPAGAGAFALASWEILIGAGLLAGVFPRTVLAMILAHLLAMATPMLFEPQQIWLRFPFQLTLTGKFLVRHLALYAAALVIVSSVAQRARGWSALVNPFAGDARPAPGAGRRPAGD